MTTHPLQPGAELDAEVAKAMGWTRLDTYERSAWGMPPNGSELRPLPRFSSDIAAAWEVVAHMRKEGWEFELKTFYLDWSAQFWSALIPPSPIPPLHRSAAAVICLAFLAAVASGRKERR